jgi:hypothetical protein
VATRTIHPLREVVTCDVCGRTLLAGEQAETYVGGGERHLVCELCVGRALHHGWVREGSQLDDHAAHRVAGDRRRLLGRLRGRTGRGVAGEGEDELGLDPGLEDFDELDPSLEPVAYEAAEAEAAVARPPADPALSSAVQRFNASKYPRTVAGVARSLGVPTVTVKEALDRPGAYLVIVAWELCWYRYLVDAHDDPEAIAVDGQGYELSELDASELTGNAGADERGAVTLLGS